MPYSPASFPIPTAMPFSWLGTQRTRTRFVLELFLQRCTTCSCNPGISSHPTSIARMISLFVSHIFILSNFIQAVGANCPVDRRGNKVLLGICCFNIVLFYLVKAYYILRNKGRDKIWDAMSAEEKVNYIATTKDEGAKRLDFRFAH
jgi:hypothetical protein